MVVIPGLAGDQPFVAAAVQEFAVQKRAHRRAVTAVGDHQRRAAHDGIVRGVIEHDHVWRRRHFARRNDGAGGGDDMDRKVGERV